MTESNYSGEGRGSTSSQGEEVVKLQRPGPPPSCLNRIGVPWDVLTLSSLAALSIFTSGRSRLPGPGPMRDTTPLQSTVLFLFPPEWGASGWMRDEPWL